MRKKIWGLLCLLSISSVLGFSQKTDSLKIGIRDLADHALLRNEQIKIRQAMAEKSLLDKKKAYEAYLPKINAEGSYTHLNAPLEFPDQFKSLLEGCQRLLIKESVSMQTAGAINFSTPYTEGSVLSQAVAANMQAIPDIQDQTFSKANLNAQMLIFSGLKVPYSIKAANHQYAANELMLESEKQELIQMVVTTYDKLALVNQSLEVLNCSENYLTEQQRFVEKAYSNGLTIDLNRQKIALTQKQLNAKRIELNSNRQLLIERLEELTGISRDTFARVKPELQPWLLANTQANSENHPAILALDEAVTALNYKQKADLAEYMPKVFVFGKKELITSSLTMLDPEWYVGIGFRWTIFDGLQAQNAAKQDKIDRYILEQRRENASNLSAINLNRLSRDLEKNNLLIENARKQVEISEQMLHLSQKQYQQGLITLTENLASLTDYENAQFELDRVILQQRASVVEYLIAGGQLTLDVLEN
jgi:outer membrane protein TolC